MITITAVICFFLYMWVEDNHSIGTMWKEQRITLILFILGILTLLYHTVMVYIEFFAASARERRYDFTSVDVDMFVGVLVLLGLFMWLVSLANKDIYKSYKD